MGVRVMVRCAHGDQERATFSSLDLPVTHHPSPITLVILPKRAIEGDANDVVSIAAAGEVGAEAPPDCRGIVPGIRGEAPAGQRLGSSSFVQVGIVDHLARDFPVDTFVAQLLLE